MSSVTTNRIITQYEVTGLDQLLKVADGLDKISKEERDALNELKKLNTGFKETGKQGVQATAEINKGFSGLNSTLKGVGGLLAGVFAVSQLKQFAAEIVQTTAKFEQYRKAMDFATGSNKEGGRAFQFLVESAKKYGLSLEALTEGYKGFAASSNLAGTSIAETNRQFIAIAKASATLGLSSERTKLVLAGLGQIASKGVVSMEELRQQIGDSLPGAMGIGARAMGMTTQAFIKFVSEGKLLSAEFLPKFATEMEKTFGPTAAQNVNTLTGTINNLSSAYELLKVRIGDAFLDKDGMFRDFTRGLQMVLDKTNELFASDKAKREEESYKRIASVVRQYGKASDEVIQKEINSRGVIIRQLEKEGKRRLDAVNDRIKSGEVLSQEFMDEFERNAKLRKQEVDLQNDIRAGLNKIKKEREDANKGLAAGVALTKELYDAEMKRLQLLTAIRKLEQPDRAGQLGADVAFYEEKLKLQQRGVEAGLKITNEEIALTKAEKTKANKDLIQAELLVPMEIRKIQDEAHENTLKLDEEFEKKRGKQKLDKVELFNEKEIDLEKQKNKELVLWAEVAADQLATIYNGFYNIRQQQRQNELTLLQQNSDEEVRLAGDNQQRVNAIREQQRIKEREIQVKAFKAQQQSAIANAIFQATPTIIKYAINPATVPLAIAAGALLATQIAFIAAQPVPEFKEGTKGVPHKGGAIVGDGGERELMVTKSGKVSWSPAKPTLVNFREPTEVFNQAQLNEVFYGTSLSSKSKTGSKDSGVLNRLENIEKAIKGLPITQLSMDEAGFEKYIRTPKRTTQIRNNRFPAL